MVSIQIHTSFCCEEETEQIYIKEYNKKGPCDELQLYVQPQFFVKVFYNLQNQAKEKRITQNRTMQSTRAKTRWHVDEHASEVSWKTGVMRCLINVQEVQVNWIGNFVLKLHYISIRHSIYTLLYLAYTICMLRNLEFFRDLKHFVQIIVGRPNLIFKTWHNDLFARLCFSKQSSIELNR